MEHGRKDRRKNEEAVNWKNKRKYIFLAFATTLTASHSWDLLPGKSIDKSTKLQNDSSV